MEGTWGLEGGGGGQGEYTLALKHIRTSHRCSSILGGIVLRVFFFNGIREKTLLTSCDHDY